MKLGTKIELAVLSLPIGYLGGRIVHALFTGALP